MLHQMRRCRTRSPLSSRLVNQPAWPSIVPAKAIGSFRAKAMAASRRFCKNAGSGDAFSVFSDAGAAALGGGGAAFCGAGSGALGAAACGCGAGCAAEGLSPAGFPPVLAGGGFSVWGHRAKDSGPIFSRTDSVPARHSPATPMGVSSTSITNASSTSSTTPMTFRINRTTAMGNYSISDWVGSEGSSSCSGGRSLRLPRPNTRRKVSVT